MNNVGLITLYKDNYGSALQCYATERVILRQGYNCNLIAVKRIFYERIIRKAKFIISHIISGDSKKQYHLSEKSRKYIDDFVNSILLPHLYTRSELKKIANNNDYSCFIVGSDQVWNLNNNIDSIYFLSFAPKNKRIAFSVSLGTDKFSKSKEQKLKRIANQIRFISTREKSGQELINRLTGLEVTLVSDPTIMLTPEEWKEFSVKGIKCNTSYILIHFIDKPSPAAIERILELHSNYNLKAIMFGYAHSELNGINDIEFVDGDPKDYVSLISDARIIITDSFHTTLFSIYFERPFNVFERQYQTHYSQNERIQFLLSKYGLLDFFNGKLVDLELDYSEVSKRVSLDRIKARELLLTQIKDTSMNALF